MPTYEVEMSDGRVFQVDSDAPPSEQDVLGALGSGGNATPAPEEQSEGMPFSSTATVAGSRTIPQLAQGAARMVANHPGATQKAINAGFTGTAAAIGGAIGGVPGAIAGGAVRGVAPTQAGIRTTMGQLAGETPQVARNAGRALTTANYATEAGLPMKAGDLISTGQPARAVDNFAESMGQRIPRVLDQYGKVIFGPEAAVAPKAPGMLRQVASKAMGVLKTASRLLPPLQALALADDIGQFDDPNRKDRGFLNTGIGASQPTPQGAELQAIETRNRQRDDAFRARQANQQQQLRRRILSALGIQ